MRNVDADKLREVIHQDPVLRVYRALGEAGTRQFRELTRALSIIYRHIEPDQLTGVMGVFKCLDDSERPITLHPPLEVTNPTALIGLQADNVTIQVLADGRLLVWKDAAIE